MGEGRPHPGSSGVGLQARFRNAMVTSDWWDNYYCDGNVVAFSRGSRGFFAMVKAGTVDQVRFPTVTEV